MKCFIDFLRVEHSYLSSASINPTANNFSTPKLINIIILLLAKKNSKVT